MYQVFFKWVDNKGRPQGNEWMLGDLGTWILGSKESGTNRANAALVSAVYKCHAGQQEKENRPER